MEKDFESYREFRSAGFTVQKAKQMVKRMRKVEIWKDVFGYDGVYQISNQGRVRSFHKNTKGKLLKGCFDKDGYVEYHLYKKGHRKHMKAHRGVAYHFINEIEGKTEINHLNGIKSDNKADNLQWCTRIENIHHSISEGLATHNNPAKGERQAKAKSREFMECAYSDVLNGISCKNFISKHKMSKQTYYRLKKKDHWIFKPT
jgi:hypothetical protein